DADGQHEWVALPNASADPAHQKDIFIELDYLTNDGAVYPHSHIPKQQALDMVGDAFKNAPVDCDAAGHNCKGVQLHFDLGPGVYAGDPYVISGGTGGNAISEGTLAACPSAPCQFPGQPAVGFKFGLQFVQSQSNLGNFQQGRAQSYHYALF